MESPKQKSRQKRKRMPTAAAALAMKRVIVEFPASLYTETEEAVRELETNRSDLIRSAVERYIEDLRHRKFERELAEGYMANAELDRQLCADFSYVDSENL